MKNWIHTFLAILISLFISISLTSTSLVVGKISPTNFLTLIMVSEFTHRIVFEKKRWKRAFFVFSIKPILDVVVGRLWPLSAIPAHFLFEYCEFSQPSIGHILHNFLLSSRHNFQSEFKVKVYLRKIQTTRLAWSQNSTSLAYLSQLYIRTSFEIKFAWFFVVSIAHSNKFCPLTPPRIFTILL